MAVAKYTSKLYSWRILCALAIVVVVSWTFYPTSNQQEVDLPTAGEIDEMIADIIGLSLQMEPSRCDILVPKNRYDEALAFFRPRKRGSFPVSWRAVGRIRIKSKDGQIRILFYYFAGKN